MNIETMLILFLTSVLEAFPISSSTHIDYLKKILITAENHAILTAAEFIMHGLIFFVIAIYFFDRWFFLLTTIDRAWHIIIKIFALGFLTELITTGGAIIFWFKPIISIPYYIGFTITSIFLASLFFLSHESRNIWNWKNAIILGIAQSLAFLPGISRFGITFSALRLVGISARRSFEISFLIELPILCAVCVKGWYDFATMQSISPISSSLFYFIPITVASSYVCFWIMEYLIEYNYIWIFSGYTLALALLFWL